MRRNDAKTLDALALATLPEKALIARLASTRYTHAAPGRRVLDINQAKEIIKATYPDRGTLTRLTRAFREECYRQEKIHNERAAIFGAMEILKQPYTTRLMPAIMGVNANPNRKKEFLRHAHLQFDAYIKAAFDEEILALMELTSQDCRSYRVDVLDCGIRPAISAVVKVTVEGNKGAFEQKFLLYKIPGTGKAMAAFTEQTDIKGAWSSQLPTAFVGSAGELRRQGYRFRNDLEQQAMVVTDPDGRERLTYWTGRAKNDE
jgi:hypothetical protein